MKAILILVSFLVLQVGLTTGQCPNSTWIHRGSKCYFLKLEEADFYENIDLCNQLNASMVSIVSKEENDQVAQITNSEPFWLGLGQMSKGSKAFYWLDKRPFAYSVFKAKIYHRYDTNYWAAYFQEGQWIGDSAFDYQYQMCWINLTQRTAFKKTPNPAAIKETLVDKQCPNSTWIRRGNKCYFLKRKGADFFENIDLCNQLNASLVSIANEKENIQVARITGFQNRFFLGLGRNPNISEAFYWLDGSPFVYSKWRFEHSKRGFKYWSTYLSDGEWYDGYQLDYASQMCSIDLARSTPLRKTPNPADIKEALVSGQCPNSTWTRLGNKCYFIKREKADLYENIALCNHLNASLVSIANEEENIQVSRLILLHGLWLGLGQWSKPSQEFYWLDGSPFKYNSWNGELNDTLEHKYFGVFLRRGLWYIRNALDSVYSYQVCSLDLKLNGCSRKMPIPSLFTENIPQCSNKSWKRIGNKCIYFNTTKVMTYMDNQALCRKLNATMVSIHSEPENFLLYRLFRHERFWIGLKAISESLYEWEDGSNMTYQSWLTLERPRNSRSTISFYQGYWYESYCPQYPSCQMPVLDNTEAQITETTTGTASKLTTTRSFDVVSTNTESSSDNVTEQITILPSIPSIYDEIKSDSESGKTSKPSANNQKTDFLDPNKELIHVMKHVIGQCPNSTWIRRGNKCYFVKREEADLYENIDLCNQLNSSLVSITSEEENFQAAQLIENLSKDGSIWLGLGQRSSGQFYWFDESSFVYDSWRGPQDVSYKYFGVYFRGGDWFTGSALTQNIQVCSIDLTLNASPRKTHIPAEFRGQCPNTAWRRLENKCIFFDTTIKMTYTENQALCKNFNATMVSIHSDAENIQLARLSGYKEFWIGLKKIADLNRDGIFEWEDGSPLTYENWRTGEPRDFAPKDWAAFSYRGDWYDTQKPYYRYPCCQISLMNNAK